MDGSEKSIWLASDDAARDVLVAVLVLCLLVPIGAVFEWQPRALLADFWSLWSTNNLSPTRDLIWTIGGAISIGIAIWRTRVAAHQANAQMKQAEAGFKSAEAALRQSEAGSKSAEAALKQSEAGAKSAEAALKQSDIAWRGQLADRFIKTAPLLGKDEIKERLGALISLEEIAKHSDEHRWSIIELIAAYVRESITVGMKPGEGAGGTLGTAQTDIAMALDIIGRLNEPEKTLKRAVNLASCNLTKYYLKGNYSHTSFNYCVFEETTFFKCQLEAASFSQINLKSLAFSRCVGPIQGDTQNLIEINNLLGRVLN